MKCRYYKIQQLTQEVESAMLSLTDYVNDLLVFVNTDVNKDYEEFLNTANRYKQDAGPKTWPKCPRN